MRQVIGKAVAVCGLVAVALLLGVPAAHASDYPPSTEPETVVTLGSTTTSTTIKPSTTTGLPFTGGNAAPLVWTGIALVGAGAFAVARARRDRRAA